MADLHYFDGQWFNTEEEMQNYLTAISEIL